MFGEVIEPQQQQRQQEKIPAIEEENRIYLTDVGLTSSYTKNSYRNAINLFIKVTIKNDNLRTLLDTRQSVVESKIIDHINYLKNVLSSRHFFVIALSEYS